MAGRRPGDRIVRSVNGLEPPAAALLRAVEMAVPGWVVRCVQRRLAGAGMAVTDTVEAAAEEAGGRARDDVVERLRTLLAQDVDEQRTNPLAVLRSAVRFPAEVLAAAGVPEPRRDEFSQRAFPEDRYDLSPATWSDVDESLHEPGIVWGAWKAKTVLDRRRAEGRR